MEYFSDVECGAKPQNQSVLTLVVWQAIVKKIECLISDASLGFSFPEYCPDGTIICGTDIQMFSSILAAEISGLSWPIPKYESEKENNFSFLDTEPQVFLPATTVILDLIHFIR